MAWWKLALLWQGIDHLRKGPMDRKKSPEVQDNVCLDWPPAYCRTDTLPSAPSGPAAHLCPVFTVTSGTIHIQNNPQTPSREVSNDEIYMLKCRSQECESDYGSTSVRVSVNGTVEDQDLEELTDQGPTRV